MMSQTSVAVCKLVLEMSRGLKSKQCGTAVGELKNRPGRGWHWKIVMNNSGMP